MADLEEILRMPDSWRRQGPAWKELTRRDTFFRVLQDTVRMDSLVEEQALIDGDAVHRSFLDEAQALIDGDAVHRDSLGEAQDWIDGWESYVKGCDKDIHYQWCTARKMVWCALEAATHPDFYRTEIGRVCFAHKEVPEFIKEDGAWAWICIRTFLGMTGRYVEVPVVAWKDKGEGILAMFHLEVIDRGAGQIAHHPADVFYTRMDKAFHSAMEDAWTSAKNLLRKEGKGVLYDGRWRLFSDGLPLSLSDNKPLKGRSAGGAAALGWYHALRGTIPDEGLVVVAQVDAEGTLRGVDGVATKTRVISLDGRLDTIVVASEENLQQAKASLKGNTKEGYIHIERCIPQTIEQLVTIRSLFAKDLLYYLQAMEEELSKNPLLDRFGRTLDDLRVPLQVAPYEPTRDIEGIHAREHFRKTPDKWKGEERDFERHIYAHRDIPFEEERESSGRRQRLDELESSLQTGILLGDPGSGKTEWLKYRACRAAREARKQLEGCEIQLQKLCFPAILRLYDISEELQKERKLLYFLIETGCISHQSFSMNDAEKFTAAILMILSTRHRMPKRLAPWVWGKIHRQGFDMSAPALLCLDGWDEVRRGQNELARCLIAFSRQTKARIFLTSRIIGYSYRLLPVDNKNDGPHRELEICAFTRDETETFVGQFFHDDQDRGQKMLAELRDKVSIAGMAQNPLLVTLLCMSFSPNPYRPPLSFPVRRSEVYQRVEGLLGEWKAEERDVPPDVEFIYAKLKLLERIASHFFPFEVIKAESLDDLITGYIRTLEDTDPLKQFLSKNRDTSILKELSKTDGILVPCGGVNNPEYMFLHLTFQEYLAASAYARSVNNEGWQGMAHIINEGCFSIDKIIDKKAWDPVWQEVIMMMAGKLRDPVPSLEMLSSKKKDDLFRHRLGLAALCLPEISSEKHKQMEIIDHITTEYFFFMDETLEELYPSHNFSLY